MATNVTEYSATESGLANLRERYSGRIFDVATTKGFAEARVARAELRDLRVNLEALRVKLKKPVLERERMIDAEAKRITAELVALEEPIDNSMKAEERRRADAKAAADEAERQRIDRLRGKLVQLQGLAIRAIGKSADEIAEAIAFAEGLQITAEAYDEFADLARIELATALKSLKDAHALQAKAEQEAADLKERMRLFEEQQAAARRTQEEEDQRRRDAEQHQREENARIAKEQKAESDRLAKVAADAEEKRKANEAERDRLAALAQQQESDRLEREAEALTRAWNEAIEEDRLRSMTSVTITPTPEQAKELIAAGSWDASDSTRSILGDELLGKLSGGGEWKCAGCGAQAGGPHAPDCRRAALGSPPVNATPGQATSGPPASIAQPAGNFDGVEGVTFVGFSDSEKLVLMAGAYAVKATPGSSDDAVAVRPMLTAAWLDGYKTGWNEAVEVDIEGGA